MGSEMNNRQKITILSLNIWHGESDSQLGELYEELMAYIKLKMPLVSIFCFQEVGLPIVKALDDLLGKEFQKVSLCKPAGDSPFFLTTYVRDDFEIKNSKELLMNDIGVGAGLLCEIDLGGGMRASIVNVHGIAQPGHKLDTPERIRQSTELISGATGDEELVIFTGDFNLLPETKSVSMFAEKGYTNLISKYQIPTTRNDMVWRLYPDNKQLYADYAFIKSSHNIDYDFAVENVLVSDHLPLITSLFVRPAQEAN